MDKKLLDEITSHAKNMRRIALDMAFTAGGSASHFGGGMSIIDILATLYFGVMNVRSVGIYSPLRDRFILSKGHGVLGYYAALAEAGFISREVLKTFERDGTSLPGHPVMNRDMGIEFTNGSLGMGLSLGIGVAIALRKRHMTNRVYVLMGDGECDEGSVWEAFMAAAQFRLKNLTAIIDRNGFQLDGQNSEVMNIDDMAEKLRAFHWDVKECDGHDISALYSAFLSERDDEKPLAVVANTIKGKGFSFAEGKNEWHHAVLTKKQYEEAVLEIEKGA